MKHTNVKTGRNDPCICKSGKKFKQCCLGKEAVSSSVQEIIPIGEKKVIARSAGYITGMAKACRLARKCLRATESLIKPGITGLEIDRFIFDFLKKRDATPATLNYQGYPASCCISRNEVVCHGIPDEKKLAEGDIVNIDLSPILNGYHGDISETFPVGECSTEARKIMGVTKISLVKAIEVVHPYGRLGDIGKAIQYYAHANGCSVVEKFVGHGIGRKFHEEPQVPHYDQGKGPVLYPGMFFTIEPMINLGTKNIKILSDGWTAITADRKLSAQFEHTILITETGVRILTAETDDAPFV